jgi:hypothetical protein
MMRDKKKLNEYLFLEFGLEGDLPSVSEDWPFQLRNFATIRQRGEEISVYVFASESEEYFAISPECNFYRVAGMTARDLQIQMNGSTWIGDREPITFETVFLGDSSVPSTKERETAIRQLVDKILGHQIGYEILDGFYLRSTGMYAALIKTEETIELILSDRFEPRRVGFPEASPWRRISFGIGELLSEGKLPR